MPPSQIGMVWIKNQVAEWLQVVFFFTSLPVSHHKSSLSCGALSSAHIIGAAPETAPDDSSSPIEVQLRPASPEDFPPLNEIERWTIFDRWGVLKMGVPLNYQFSCIFIGFSIIIINIYKHLETIHSFTNLDQRVSWVTGVGDHGPSLQSRRSLFLRSSKDHLTQWTVPPGVGIPPKNGWFRMENSWNS